MEKSEFTVKEHHFDQKETISGEIHGGKEKNEDVNAADLSAKRSLKFSLVTQFSAAFFTCWTSSEPFISHKLLLSLLIFD